MERPREKVFAFTLNKTVEGFSFKQYKNTSLILHVNYKKHNCFFLLIMLFLGFKVTVSFGYIRFKE